MSKKILVLTGSPRKGGNSDLLADAFIKSAEASGHKVTKFECGHKNIKPCTACNACYSKESACVFGDDFNELAPLLEHSDMIVLATPMYWFTFPAQLKAGLDKMYALLVGGRQSSIQESMLLVCGECGEESDFDGLIKTYQAIAFYEKWKDAGVLVAPAVLEKGDILKTDFLEKAEHMGRAIK
ncbi:MAG: flavodoxin family protein [Syntrophomonas sp.]